MSWQVEFRAGVWLPQVGWWLDAHFPVERSFVSHAHSDHTALHREVLCSAGTSALMQARLPGKRTEHVLSFGQTERLTSACAITLHPAGHIFGSAQSLLEHADHGRLLYTGDFKLRRGLSAEPCATPGTDLLIMETTFGRPHYVFPPTEQVLRDIAHFCHETIANGEVPVLFGYSLGKSQELLSGLAAAQLPVMLHPQTHKLTLVYERCGISFPPHREFDAAEVAGHVVICPPQSRDSAFVRRIPRARTAVITGWAIDPGAIYRYQCDAAFPLSDHADFPDLLRYVELVQPKRVLTLHGFAQEFAGTLRERGIEAWAIGQDNQLELGIAASRPTPAAAMAAMPTGQAERCATPTTEPTAFLQFAVVADAVKATPSKLEKVAALRDYLAALPPEDAATAATFFTGRAFPQRDPRNLNLGWAVIKRAVLEVAGVTEADYRAAYHRYADAGDASGAVLAQRPRDADSRGGDLGSRDVSTEPSATQSEIARAGAERTGFPEELSPAAARESAAGRGCSLGDVAAFFRDAAAARGPLAKLQLLTERLTILSPDEARYLIKIITGDLRIGLKEGLLEEAVAAASGQPLDAVREANMLCGDIAAVMRAARRDELASIQLTVFHPLQFMLASPEPTAEAILARMREAAAPDEPPASSPEPSLTGHDRAAGDAAGGTGGVPCTAEISARDEGVASPGSGGEREVPGRTGAVRAASAPEREKGTAPPAPAANADASGGSEPTAPADPRPLSRQQAVTVWLEEKYDGIRCQLHKAGTRVELYSRDLNRITEQFPDLVRAAADIPGDFIGDGELLAWRDGRALPFAELQKRLGRKGDDFFLGEEIPVSISFYDLLWLNGRALLKQPLSTRRALLEQLFADRGKEPRTLPADRSAPIPPRAHDAGAPAGSTLEVGSSTLDVGRSSGPAAWTQRFRVAPVRHATTADEIEAAFIAARQRGNEGLMAKDPRSFYTPGRRGLAWLKLKKAYATLDVVVVGVEYGHGKRRDVLSDYTFAIRDTEHDRLLTVGKAYSGLTDAEIARLTQHFLEHTLEERGRYRVVVPDTVIEVGFDIIQPSTRHQSGFALRFPRIARLRPDKTPADIDTLDTCRRLAAAGSFAPAEGDAAADRATRPMDPA
jgi:ATP-dependent DNA ligase/Cft2 family RNA processing exonuclease